MELRRELFAHAVAQSIFDEFAGQLAGVTGEALCLYGCLAIRLDGDDDGLTQVPPPTWMLSRTEPSVSDCSVTE